MQEGGWEKKRGKGKQRKDKEGGVGRAGMGGK